MPIRERTLRVYPNPWIQIDEFGRPCGVVRLDPFEHNMNRTWVGAWIAEAKETRKGVAAIIKGKAYAGTTSTHALEWGFAEGEVEIPNTGYYRQHINEGSLVAADLKTAKECGISPKDFQEPKAFLAAARAAAIVDFDAHTGEGAFETLAARRAEDAKSAEPVAAAPETAAPAQTKTSESKGK